MHTLLGVQISVDIFYVDTMTTSYFSPESDSIVISRSRISRAISGRPLPWIRNHELAHAVLNKHYSKIGRELSRVFGSLSDEAYTAEAIDEIKLRLIGYDSDCYVSARAALCPEEDFAECCAFLASRKGKIPRNTPEEIQYKMEAILKAFGKLKKNKKSKK